MKISIEDGDSPKPLDHPSGDETEETNAGEDAERTIEPHETEEPEKRTLFGKKKGHGKKFKKIIDKLKDELATAEDKAIRAVADADNYRKRLAREGDEAKRYAASSIVESLLPILDNLQKAASASADDNEGNIETLRRGVELVAKQFMETLAKHGLEKLDVVGKPLDPDTSEAIQMIETEKAEDGHVVEEYIPGYRFKQRVIRPAKVVVAKSPDDG